jgi:hypothetical protein
MKPIPAVLLICSLLYTLKKEVPNEVCRSLKKKLIPHSSVPKKDAKMLRKEIQLTSYP